MNGYTIKTSVVYTTSRLKRVMNSVAIILLIVLVGLPLLVIAVPLLMVAAVVYVLPSYIIWRITKHRRDKHGQPEVENSPLILHPLLDQGNLQLQYREMDALDIIDDIEFEGIHCHQLLSSPEISGLHKCYFQVTHENYNGYLFLPRYDFDTEAEFNTTIISFNLQDFSINTIHQFRGFPFCTFHIQPDGNLRITTTEEFRATHLDIQF